MMMGMLLHVQTPLQVWTGNAWHVGSVDPFAYCSVIAQQ